MSDEGDLEHAVFECNEFPDTDWRAGGGCAFDEGDGDRAGVPGRHVGTRGREGAVRRARAPRRPGRSALSLSLISGEGKIVSRFLRVDTLFYALYQGLK